MTYPRKLTALALLAVLGLVAFWVVTTPSVLTLRALPNRVANLANGELIYNAGGCHSCHLPAKDSTP